MRTDRLIQVFWLALISLLLVRPASRSAAFFFALVLVATVLLIAREYRQR